MSFSQARGLLFAAVTYTSCMSHTRYMNVTYTLHTRHTRYTHVTYTSHTSHTFHTLITCTLHTRHIHVCCALPSSPRSRSALARSLLLTLPSCLSLARARFLSLFFFSLSFFSLSPVHDFSLFSLSACPGGREGGGRDRCRGGEGWRDGWREGGRERQREGGMGGEREARRDQPLSGGRARLQAG